MSASSWVWTGSFFSVVEMVGPTSSRSGKKTSMRSTPFSWAMAMTRCVTSSFASRMISPVSGSTTSDAATAPSRSASSMRTASTPAARSALTAAWVSLRPLVMTVSVPGMAMSSPARRPTIESATPQ